MYALCVVDVRTDSYLGRGEREGKEGKGKRGEGKEVKQMEGQD